MNKLEDLGWPETTLFNMSFQGNSLSFSMHDLVSYENPVKFEIVNVIVSDFEALRIELRPFIDGKYEAMFAAAEIGTISEEDDVFEGIIYENPFSTIEAEYFWVSGDLRAKSILINRTGEFVFTPRKD